MSAAPVTYSISKIVDNTLKELTECNSVYEIAFEDRSWFHPQLWLEFPGRRFLPQMLMCSEISRQEAFVHLIALIINKLNGPADSMTNAHLFVLCSLASSFQHYPNDFNTGFLLFQILNHPKISSSETISVTFGRLVSAATAAGCNLCPLIVENPQFSANVDNFYRSLHYMIYSKDSFVSLLKLAADIMNNVSSDSRPTFCYNLYSVLRHFGDNFPGVYRECVNQSDYEFPILDLMLKNSRTQAYWPLIAFILPMCRKKTKEVHVDNFFKELVKVEKKQQQKFQQEALVELRVAQDLFGVKWPPILDGKLTESNLLLAYKNGEVTLKECSTSAFCETAEYIKDAGLDVPDNFVEILGANFIKASEIASESALTLSQVIKLVNEPGPANSDDQDLVGPAFMEYAVQAMKMNDNLENFMKNIFAYIMEAATDCPPRLFLFLRNIFHCFASWKGVKPVDYLSPMVEMISDLLTAGRCNMIEHLLMIFHKMVSWSIYVGCEEQYIAQAVMDLRCVASIFYAKRFAHLFENIPIADKMSDKMSKKLLALPLVLASTKHDPSRALEFVFEQLPDGIGDELIGCFVRFLKSDNEYSNRLVHASKVLQSERIIVAIGSAVETEIAKTVDLHDRENMIRVATIMVDGISPKLAYRILKELQLELSGTHDVGFCGVLLTFLEAFFTKKRCTSKVETENMLVLLLEVLINTVDTENEQLARVGLRSIDKLFKSVLVDSKKLVILSMVVLEHMLTFYDNSKEIENLGYEAVRALFKNNMEMTFSIFHTNILKHSVRFRKVAFQVLSDIFIREKWNETIECDRFSLRSLNMTFGELLDRNITAATFYDNLISLLWVYNRQLDFLKYTKGHANFDLVAVSYYAIASRSMRYKYVYKAFIDNKPDVFVSRLTSNSYILNGKDIADPVKYFIVPFLKNPLRYKGSIKKVDNDVDTFVSNLTINWDELAMDDSLTDFDYPESYDVVVKMLHNEYPDIDIIDELYCSDDVLLKRANVVYRYDANKIVVVMRRITSKLDPVKFASFVARHLKENDEVYVDFYRYAVKSADVITELLATIPSESKISFVNLSEESWGMLTEESAARVFLLSPDEWPLRKSLGFTFDTTSEDAKVRIKFERTTFDLYREKTYPKEGVSVTPMPYDHMKRVLKGDDKFDVVDGENNVVLSLGAGDVASQVAKLLTFKRACAPVSRSARSIKYEWVPLKMSSFLGCVLAAIQDPTPETQSITLNMAQSCFSAGSMPIMITQTFPVKLEFLFEHMKDVEILEDSLRYLVHQKMCHPFIALWLNTVESNAVAARSVRLLINSRIYNKSFWSMIKSECVIKEAIKQILKSKDGMFSSALAILGSAQPIALHRIMNETDLHEAVFARLPISAEQVLDYFLYLCENDTFGNLDFLKSVFYTLASKWPTLKELYEKLCQIKDATKGSSHQIIGAAICTCCDVIGILDQFRERIASIDTSVSLFFRVAMNRDSCTPEIVKEVYQSFNRYGRLRNFKESMILCGEGQSANMFVISLIELGTCHTSGRKTCITNMIAATKNATIESFKERYGLLEDHSDCAFSRFVLKCTFGLLKKYPFHGILCELFRNLCHINGLSYEDSARFHLPLVFLSNEFLDFGVFSCIRTEATRYIISGLLCDFTCAHMTEAIDFLIDSPHTGVLNHMKDSLSQWLLKTMAKSTDDSVSVKASHLFSILDMCEAKPPREKDLVWQTPFSIEETEAREMIKIVASNQ